VLGWTDDHFGRTWVIWDLINIAWLMQPGWVPSALLSTPLLGDDRKWSVGPADRHFWREAYDIDRDAIFRDLFAKLKTAP
jgi:purine nucleosidase